MYKMIKTPRTSFLTLKKANGNKEHSESIYTGLVY